MTEADLDGMVEFDIAANVSISKIGNKIGKHGHHRYMDIISSCGSLVLRQLELFGWPHEHCPICSRKDKEYIHTTYKMCIKKRNQTKSKRSPLPHESKYLPLELKSMPVTESLWALSVVESSGWRNGASLTDLVTYCFFSLALLADACCLAAAAAAAFFSSESATLVWISKAY